MRPSVELLNELYRLNYVEQALATVRSCQHNSSSEFSVNEPALAWRHGIAPCGNLIVSHILYFLRPVEGRRSYKICVMTRQSVCLSRRVAPGTVML
jgi:hypothetical protein